MTVKYTVFLVPWWDNAWEISPRGPPSHWTLPQGPMVVICTLMTPLSTLLPYLSQLKSNLFCFLGSSPFANTLTFQSLAKYSYCYKLCLDLLRKIQSLSPMLAFLFMPAYLSTCWFLSPQIIFIVNFLCTMSPASALSVSGENKELMRWDGDKLRWGKLMSTLSLLWTRPFQCFKNVTLSILCKICTMGIFLLSL